MAEPVDMNEPRTEEVPVQPAGLTQADVLNLLGQLGTHINNVATTVQGLTNSVTAFVHTQSASHTKDIAVVEKPTSFKGKGSESARLFRNAFYVWALHNAKSFYIRDVNGNFQLDVNGHRMLNARKMITSALSFMSDDAAIWARPHIETLAQNKAAFNDSWDEFLKQFKAKFEPIDATADAKNKILALKQGKQTFASLISEFETWSDRTGWSPHDLFDRLKACMNEEYLRRMSYFPMVASDYDTLKRYGNSIDLQLNDLRNNTQGFSSSSTTTSVPRNSTPAFRDTNAMDIDASNFDSMYEGLTNRDDIIKQWRKAMTGRCKCCGSKAHRFDTTRHPQAKCNHCGKEGHWQKVCVNRLLGKPKVQSVSATSDPAASSSSDATTPSSSATISASQDPEAEVAALKDFIDIQNKQMADLVAKVEKAF